MEYTFDYLYENYLKDIKYNIKMVELETSNMYMDNYGDWNFGKLLRVNRNDKFRGAKDETLYNLKQNVAVSSDTGSILCLIKSITDGFSFSLVLYLLSFTYLSQVTSYGITL